MQQLDRDATAAVVAHFLAVSAVYLRAGRQPEQQPAVPLSLDGAEPAGLFGLPALRLRLRA